MTLATKQQCNKKKKKEERERERKKRKTLEDDEMRHAFAVFQRIQEFSRIFEKNLNVTYRTNGHSHPVSFTDFPVAAWETMPIKLCDKCF